MGVLVALSIDSPTLGIGSLFMFYACLEGSGTVPRRLDIHSGSSMEYEVGKGASSKGSGTRPGSKAQERGNESIAI